MACLRAERAAVRELAASCHTPVGVHADGARMRGFAGLPDGSEWLVDEVPMDGDDAALTLARRMLAAGAADLLRAARRWPRHDRIVHLVGAGPGDPGLLTVRAVELIGAADVILYDRLIPPEALAHARPGAELVYVGKEGGGPQVPQDETHRLLLEHARAGRRGRAAQGRRPVRVRPRRRGGARARAGRHPVRGRARRHRGRRRARLRGHPGHPPRAGERRRVRHRPRGPRQARVGARLAGAGRASPARSSSTWASARCRGSPSG